MELNEIQIEIAEWTAKNFNAPRGSIDPLLGIQEEVGELSHAVLKRKQNIRINEDHKALIVDSIGDIMIFLIDFCNEEHIDIEEALNITWDEVKQRDWKKNKING